MTSENVVPLRSYRPPQWTGHPLVTKWRRQAEDLYITPEARAALRQCAKELDEHVGER